MANSGFAIVGFMTACLVSAVGACVGYIYGDTHGRSEEAAGRAEPSSYPKGSCSELIASCAKQGGTMNFHEHPLTGETDEPTCNKWVQVRP
jgi:hypothetical protein